jgi:hypothetical protein
MSSNFATAAWTRSTYSTSDGGQCVEVALGLVATVPVRDSKVPHRAMLLFPAAGWAAFVGSLRMDEFPIR